ncbi:MAG TPA: terminase small subunit [Stellaceae bacterium]|nr:terminase small subunit [Stellaceae bacterium]
MTKRKKPRLTPKQRRFVIEYLIDMNATQAALRAGYSKKNPKPIAWELLHKRPAVAEAISKELAAREKRILISGDRVLQQLARIAFADVRELAQAGDDGVDVTSLKTLSDDLAAAIVELSVNGKTVRLKLSRIEALKALARHLGLFDKKPNQEEPASQHDEDRLPAREILRRKLAQLAGEEVPED